MRRHGVRSLVVLVLASASLPSAAAFGGTLPGAAMPQSSWAGVGRGARCGGARPIIASFAAGDAVEAVEAIKEELDDSTDAAAGAAPTRLRAADPAPDPDEIRAPPTPSLLSHQRAASAVSSSFEPRPFDPPPLLTNEHLQTIGGVFLRHRPECAYVTDPGPGGVFAAWEALAGLSASDRPDETRCDFWDERERIIAPDGDYFHVDYKYADGEREVEDGNERAVEPRRGRPSLEARGTVLMLHGLESNSNSSLSTNMAAAYVRRGFDVACLNFRGCCGDDGDRTQLAGYHLGFTDDIKQLLQIHTERWRDGGKNDRAVYVSGFSLGANVALKALGELGEKARTLYGVRGAAVTGAPFDNELNIKKVESPGFNKLVYSNNFLGSMKRRLQEQIDDLCLIVDDDPDADEGEVDLNRCLSAESIAEMECELIAPLYGFVDNVDYYRKCSCVYYCEGIAVPTLVINAGDDPFFDPTCWPIDKTSEGGGVAPIKMVRTEHGGHLGFMFHRPSIVERKEAEAAEAVGGRKGGRESWMPTELARFLDHVATADKEGDAESGRVMRNAWAVSGSDSDFEIDVDPAVLYFMGTAGFRPEVARGEMVNTAVSQALREAEDIKRKALAVRRSGFNETFWQLSEKDSGSSDGRNHSQAKGVDDVSAEKAKGTDETPSVEGVISLISSNNAAAQRDSVSAPDSTATLPSAPHEHTDADGINAITGAPTTDDLVALRELVERRNAERQEEIDDVRQKVDAASALQLSVLTSVKQIDAKVSFVTERLELLEKSVGSLQTGVDRLLEERQAQGVVPMEGKHQFDHNGL